MRPARLELYAGRTLLVLLMGITIVPFISIFTTALHPSGTVPDGFAWPADPQWGNFIEALYQAVAPTIYARFGNWIAGLLMAVALVAVVRRRIWDYWAVGRSEAS